MSHFERIVLLKRQRKLQNFTPHPDLVRFFCKKEGGE